MTDDCLADLVELEEDTTPPAAYTLAMRDNPAAPPYPRGLVLDLVLKTAPVADLLTAYRISAAEFKALIDHPVFRRDYQDMRDKVREEGFTFKAKAQAQAEEYLSQAWKMVHDADTPANVRAQLIQWTTKVAGLEPKQTAADSQPSLTEMAATLKSMPSSELEMRVMSIVMRKQPPKPEFIDVSPE